MKTLPIVFLALLTCSIGCSDAPQQTDAQAPTTEEVVDTVAVRLDKAKQEIEDAGKELDQLINDL